jgi:hypothetical protein
MEFFIPYVDDLEKAEHVWRETKNFMGLQCWTQVTDRRLF